ncbi:MAG: protein kinase domain-containing protein, partial [Ktedonobacteraceae bacterium]
VLEYLHFKKQPVIFRDVKPANIMLTPGKKVFLIDFGIARVFHPSKAKDTTPLGSPGFAAPEQYGRAQSDPRTDIYGLGATLQTLLTGRDPQELRAGESSRRPHPIPPPVQTLLDEMMDTDPNHRPRNMTVVKQKLKHTQARLHRVPNYILGLILGIIFSFGSLAIFTASLNGYLSAITQVCIVAPAIMIGATILFAFLFIPGKRYVTFGVLTVAFVLLAFIRLLS